MASPTEIKYLNFGETMRESKGVQPDLPIQLNINLSRKVYIKRRVVYDIFMMLGEVGGLRDFIALTCVAILGAFSERFLLAELASKLFLQFDEETGKSRKLVHPNFSTISVLCHVLTSSKCPWDRKAWILKKGLHRLKD